MSRDGMLPPGVTEEDVDRACPGYDDMPEEDPRTEHEKWEERLYRFVSEYEEMLVYAPNLADEALEQCRAIRKSRLAMRIARSQGPERAA